MTLHDLHEKATPAPWELGGVIEMGMLFDSEQDIVPPEGNSGPVAVVRAERADAALIVELRNAYASGDLIEREKVDALAEAAKRLAPNTPPWQEVVSFPRKHVESLRAALESMNK